MSKTTYKRWEYPFPAIPQELMDAVDADVYNITTADITWYIDPVSGDDDNDGSASSPFQTFACLERLPTYIAHDVTIKPAAGTYTYFPQYLYFHNRGGRLIIDASGETYPVDSGPYTIASVTEVGDVGMWGVGFATDVNVSSPGWTTDEHWGKYIHLSSGTYSGFPVPIFKNDTDTLRTHENSYGHFAAAGTFNITTEPVVINIDHTIQFKSNCNYHDTSEAFLFMAGIKFNSSHDDTMLPVYTLWDINCIISSCTFGCVEDRGAVLEIMGSTINNEEVPAGTFDNTVLNSIWYYGWISSPNDGTALTTWQREMQLSGMKPTISMCTMRGGLANLAAESPTIAYTLCSDFLNSNVATAQIVESFFEQINWSSSTALNIHDGYAYIVSAWIESANIALAVKNKAGCRLEWLKGEDTTDDYAIHVGEFGKIRNLSVSDVTITGAVGTIEFAFDNSTYASWPGTNTAYIDGAGSFVATP